MKSDGDFIHLPDLYVKLGDLKKHLKNIYNLTLLDYMEAAKGKKTIDADKFAEDLKYKAGWYCMDNKKDKANFIKWLEKACPKYSLDADKAITLVKKNDSWCTDSDEDMGWLINKAFGLETKHYKEAVENGYYEEMGYAEKGTWFKEAVEKKAPYSLAGWAKSSSPNTRRAKAIESRNQKLSKHNQYISAGRALQALANVTKDPGTRKSAKEDAEYFFSQAKKFDLGGAIISRKEAIDTIKDKLGKKKSELSKWSDLDLELEYKRLFDTEVAVYADGGGIGIGDDEYPDFVESEASDGATVTPDVESEIKGIFSKIADLFIDYCNGKLDYQRFMMKKSDIEQGELVAIMEEYRPDQAANGGGVGEEYPEFIESTEAENGVTVSPVWNVSFFDKDGKLIDTTQIDEKDENLAWQLFGEFGHTREEGMYLEWEEETDPDAIAQSKHFGNGGRTAKNDDPVIDYEKMTITFDTEKRANAAKKIVTDFDFSIIPEDQVNVSEKIISFETPVDFKIALNLLFLDKKAAKGIVIKSGRTDIPLKFLNKLSNELYDEPSWYKLDRRDGNAGSSVLLEAKTLMKTGKPYFSNSGENVISILNKFKKDGTIKAANGAEIDAMFDGWKNEVKKLLESKVEGSPNKMKVLDIESNTIHNPVLVDYDQDLVIMENEEFGRTSNSLDNVKFFFEGEQQAPTTEPKKKILTPAEVIKQKASATTTSATTTTTGPTVNVSKQPAFQKSEKKEPNKYAVMLKDAWSEAKGAGIVLISDEYMERVEEAILNDLSSLVYEDMLREILAYLLDQQIVLKSKPFMKKIKETLEQAADGKELKTITVIASDGTTAEVTPSGTANNFDIRISRKEAKRLLEEGKFNDDKFGSIMCKEYGQDEDWQGLFFEPGEEIDIDEDYTTLEISIRSDAKIEEKAADGASVSEDKVFYDFKNDLEAALFKKYGAMLTDTTIDNDFIHTAIRNRDSIDKIVDYIGDTNDLTPIAPAVAAVEIKSPGKPEKRAENGYICVVKDRNGKLLGKYPISYNDDRYACDFLSAIGVRLRPGDKKEIVDA